MLIRMVGFGQEYDDLYFNKSDREKQKKTKTETSQMSTEAG